MWSGLTTSGLAQWNLILKHKENCVSFLPQQKLPLWLLHGAFRLTCEYLNSEELEISRYLDFLLFVTQRSTLDTSQSITFSREIDTSVDSPERKRMA